MDTFSSMSDFNDMDDLTLSQALDKYEVTCEDLNNQSMYGLFEIIPEDLKSVDLKKHSRFGEPTTLDDIKKIQKDQESKNTRKNTTWGWKVFNKRRQTRDFSDILSCTDAELKCAIVFHGRTSKNFTGGLNQRKICAKNIHHYCEKGSERNLYDIYREYIDIVKEGPFYRRPLPGSSLRFSAQPIGVNKLGSIVKDMCTDAGVEGNFSNHAGKRTCATTLFQAGFDEQLIKGRTGHRSDAVRAYQRPSKTQLEQVSTALNPPKCEPLYVSNREKENAPQKKCKTDDVKAINCSERFPFINISNCEVKIVYEK